MSDRADAIVTRELGNHGMYTCSLTYTDCSDDKIRKYLEDVGYNVALDFAENKTSLRRSYPFSVRVIGVEGRTYARIWEGRYSGPTVIEIDHPSEGRLSFSVDRKVGIDV